MSGTRKRSAAPPSADEPQSPIEAEPKGFYARLRALRGKVNFDDFDLDELRRDREFDERGNVINRD